MLLFFYKSQNSVGHRFVPPSFLHLYYSIEKHQFQFIFYMKFIRGFYAKRRTFPLLFPAPFTNSIKIWYNIFVSARKPPNENSTDFSVLFFYYILVNLPDKERYCIPCLESHRSHRTKAQCSFLKPHEAGKPRRDGQVL